MNKLQTIEYFYAFDIHSNAFVPFYFFCWTVKYFILPIIVNEGKASLLLGNILYAVGCTMYIVVTAMGYFSLPFIQRNKNVTKLAGVAIGLFIVLTVLGVNVPVILLKSYF